MLRVLCPRARRLKQNHMFTSRYQRPFRYLPVSWHERSTWKRQFEQHALRLYSLESRKQLGTPVARVNAGLRGFWYEFYSRLYFRSIHFYISLAHNIRLISFVKHFPKVHTAVSISLSHGGVIDITSKHSPFGDSHAFYSKQKRPHRLIDGNTSGLDHS